MLHEQLGLPHHATSGEGLGKGSVLNANSGGLRGEWGGRALATTAATTPQATTEGPGTTPQVTEGSGTTPQAVTITPTDFAEESDTVGAPSESTTTATPKTTAAPTTPKPPITAKSGTETTTATT